jgi:hypothetical protein
MQDLTCSPFRLCTVQQCKGYMFLQCTNPAGKCAIQTCCLPISILSAVPSMLSGSNMTHFLYSKHMSRRVMTVSSHKYRSMSMR